MRLVAVVVVVAVLTASALPAAYGSAGVGGSAVRVAVGRAAHAAADGRLAASTAAGGGVFNVLDYGAKGDGVTKDTGAVQSAINAAGAAGGGIVLLPPGRYLCGSLFLRSHVTFRIQTGATLLGSQWYDDYIVVWRGPFYKNSRAGLLNGGRCLDATPPTTDCSNLRSLVNVTIDGGGKIDGQGQAWWYAYGPAIDAFGGRPCLVDPMWVNGLVIRQLNITRSPFYHVHPHLCSNVLIDEVTIFAEVPHVMGYGSHNTDGIDPENSQNVTVQNSVIWAGDDCMAVDARAKYPPMENLLVRNVTCYTPFSLGSGTMGGIRNVTFENCTVLGNWGHDHSYKPQWWHTAIRLKTCRGRGGYAKDITYRNIVALDVDLVVDFQMWYPCQNSSGTHNYDLCRNLSATSPPSLTPYYENIVFDGIKGVNVWRPAWLNCLPESPCTGVSFHNVDIESDLPWLCSHVKPTFGKNIKPRLGDTCFGPDGSGLP